MLWHKGWLETRYRLLFALGFVVLFQLLLHRSSATPQGILGLVLFPNPVLVVMSYTMLAGAGVATQPSFVASKGIHGSTLFTLSLPVTRLRLLSVRAAIGWLEGSGVIAVLCCALWFRSPALRAMVGRERCCTMPPRSLPVAPQSTPCRYCWGLFSTSSGEPGERCLSLPRSGGFLRTLPSLPSWTSLKAWEKARR